MSNDYNILQCTCMCIRTFGTTLVVIIYYMCKPKLSGGLIIILNRFDKPQDWKVITDIFYIFNRNKKTICNIVFIVISKTVTRVDVFGGFVKRWVGGRLPMRVIC